MSRKTTSGRKTGGARAIGALAATVARPAFEAHGFPSAALVTDWALIAGADLASFTQPERLSWPPRAAEGDDRQRQGATLILRVDGPRALELQHSAEQIIDRINRYFGYAAVTRLKFVQAPIVRDRPDEARRPSSGAPDLPAGGDLDQALRRLDMAVGDRD